MDNQAFRARLAAAVVTTSGQIKSCLGMLNQNKYGDHTQINV